MNAKMFPLDVVLSCTSGKLWTRSFREVHALIEWTLGHPVWTHEMASKALCDDVRDRLVSQHPALAEVGEPPGVDGLSGDAFLAALEPWMDEQRRAYGDHLSIAQGREERTEGPLASAVRMFGAGKVLAAVLEP